MFNRKKIMFFCLNWIMVLKRFLHSSLLQRDRRFCHELVPRAVAATLAMLAALVSYKKAKLEQAGGAFESSSSSLKNEETDASILTIDFFDRIADKPYLRVPGLDDARPPGVPRTLRLLMVDLPTPRVYGGIFQTVRDFPDGVATRRMHNTITDKLDSYKTSPIDEIKQKTWVKSFVQCRRVGDPNAKQTEDCRRSKRHQQQVQCWN
jgi:hypothetical protein